MTRGTAWLLAFGLAAGCRASAAVEPGGAEAPRYLMEDVPVRAWHAEHIDTLVACMQGHGTPELQRGAWQRLERTQSVLLPLNAGQPRSWLRVFTRVDRRENVETFGLELRLRVGRVELLYVEDAPDGDPEPAGRVGYFVGDEREPEFWIDLAGPDLLAPVRDPGRAREAALASMARYERRMEEHGGHPPEGGADEFSRGPRARGSSRGGELSKSEAEAAKSRLRSEMARRRNALERSLPELLESLRRMYPIDDPACAPPLPRAHASR